MACCGKQRKRFLESLNKGQVVKNRPLTEIPDELLTPKQLRIKKRDIRIFNRRNRVIARQQRAERLRAEQESKKEE